MKSLNLEQMELIKGGAAPSSTTCYLTGLFAAVTLFSSSGMTTIQNWSTLKACWNS